VAKENRHHIAQHISKLMMKSMPGFMSKIVDGRCSLCWMIRIKSFNSALLPLKAYPMKC